MLLKIHKNKKPPSSEEPEDCVSDNVIISWRTVDEIRKYAGGIFSSLDRSGYAARVLSFALPGAD